jgi:hypothetical protein
VTCSSSAIWIRSSARVSAHSLNVCHSTAHPSQMSSPNCTSEPPHNAQTPRLKHRCLPVPFENQLTMHQRVLHELLHPERLLSCPEILSNPCPVAREPGVYAWYFRQVPSRVPIQGCHMVGMHTLMYIGISPCRPQKIVSARVQSLRRRVRYHARGNAEGSTLRLSLGCLLAGELGIQLRRVGGGERMTFTNGEQTLSAWMAANAFVTWTSFDAPWELERALISSMCVPQHRSECSSFCS